MPLTPDEARVLAEIEKVLDRVPTQPTMVFSTRLERLALAGFVLVCLAVLAFWVGALILIWQHIL